MTKQFVAAATLAALVLGPVQAFASTNGVISTGLTRGAGGGQAPIVKVKWEMNAPYASLLGTDDDEAAGAQFDAPGNWGAKMNYSVCAVVTDPNGADDIYGVYADIYYPDNKKTHKYSDRFGAVTSESVDTPTGGCGAFIEENTLIKLSKTDGYNLICNTIRTNNIDLPTWAEGYNYDEICAADGELMKEEAYVYCDDKYLLWEEPAGLYTVKVFALDKAGNTGATLTNDFEYLPYTGFEKDFTGVSYGEVLLNTHKKIAGDLSFGTADRPTVRNTGNTRTQLSVAQDDMGLGQSSGLWNVQFDGRLGNAEGDWAVYNPFDYKGTGAPVAAEYKPLLEVLDLSETEEADFSILVKKWPDANTSYSGSMWLSASPANDLTCPEPG